MLDEPESAKFSPPMWLGIGLTAFWAMAVIVYLCSAAGEGLTQWSRLLATPPNEFGDALAGMFAPLAFLWLVVATLLQREELKQNRRALLLQAKELHHAVEQQTAQTELWKKSINADETESAEQKIERTIESLASFIVKKLGKVSLDRFDQNNNPQPVRFIGEKNEFAQLLVQKNYDEIIQNLPRQLDRVKAALEANNPGWQLRKSKNASVIDQALERAQEILRLSDTIPQSSIQNRIKDVDLKKVVERLEFIKQEFLKLDHT